MSEDIRICWTSANVLSRGVRRVRVQRSRLHSAWIWKNADKWEHFTDDELFDDREAAIADGERKRAERRESLQRQLDKLAKPMRVVDKIKDAPTHTTEGRETE